MPVYFSDLAPYCPVSRDQPVGPGRAPNIRSSIPGAFDFESALAAANAARLILQQLVTDRIKNNVFTPKTLNPRTIDVRQRSRWIEQTDMRITNKYKYYGFDKDTWIITERIEQMVWYDTGWKTYLVWNYGEKGEGKLLSSNATNTSGIGGFSGGVTVSGGSGSSDLTLPDFDLDIPDLPDLFT